MGVHPEPARCADDVRRRAPEDDHSTLQRGATASACRSKVRLLAAATLAGFAFTALLGSTEATRAAVAEADAAAPGHATKLTGQRPERSGVPRLDPETTATLPGAVQDAAQVLRFGAMSVARPVVEAVLRAATDTGVEPAYMMALADKESSFRTEVKAATSSAQGLFQFVTATWFEMVRDYGGKYGLTAEAAAIRGQGAAIGIADEALRQRVLALRNDPYLAGVMAGEMINRDRARIERRIGRDLKTTELYLAHFLGTASAGKLLTLSDASPDTAAASEFRSAAKANRNIFTRKEGKQRRALTVAEVYAHLDALMDHRLSRYEGVEAHAPAPTAPTRNVLLDARLGVADPAIPSLH